MAKELKIGTAEEREALAEQALTDEDIVDALAQEIAGSSRIRRQKAASTVALIADKDASVLLPFADDIASGLTKPEAQTRWEILDALTVLVPEYAKEIGAAYEGAETALFDELSATLRLSAFKMLCAWGATERGRSKKVWPIVDEAIQCYHGDLEYRDMLGHLYVFAEGKIAGDVAEDLAARLHFDAENGKGAYLKARSREIYDMLVKRFKLDAPKKKARVQKDDVEDEEE